MGIDRGRCMIDDPLEGCPPGLTQRVVKESGILDQGSRAGRPRYSRGYGLASLIMAALLVGVICLGEVNPEGYTHLGKNTVALASQLADSFKQLFIF